MNRRYRGFLSSFTLSLVLCVPLGITLTHIFMVRLSDPFQSPYLCTASLGWCAAYGGVIYAMLGRLREKGTYGVLLYGCLITFDYVWLNYFWR